MDRCDRHFRCFCRLMHSNLRRDSNLKTDNEVQPIASSSNTNTSPAEPFDCEIEYRMNHKRRGKALVFSHYQYYDLSIEDRKGNDVDERAITEELTKLGFEVEIYEDWFEKKLKKKLKNVAKEDHSDADCLAIVIMSHGKEVEENENGSGCQKKYQISAFDKYYEDSEIFTNFIGKKCPSLLGKPKIFIIQTCRGPKTERVNTWAQSDRVRQMGKEAYRSPQANLGEEQITQEHQIPDHADFLVVQAAFNGFVSFRNKKKGSVFIQALCDEFKKNYEKENMDDLETLLTSVKRKVAFHNAQMPTVFSTLTKKVYFRRS